MNPQVFQQAVLGWYSRHGRRGLPWQQHINPYRVWLSEIMLQQTRVTAVLPYFQRFVAELPDVHALAAADEDRVLHLWTGLGYYARARNLQRAARQVVAEYGGRFPDTVAQLSRLPGVGRSTAGAIRSIAFQQPAAILDGNVKRVLARHAAIAGWPGKTSVLNELWRVAETYTPAQHCREYSQAMMDLGATICSRGKPNCELCPLKSSCKARKLSRQEQFPGRKPRRQMPLQSTVMLIVSAGDEVYLQRRPATGLWGGLWSFPQFDTLTEAEHFCTGQFGETGELEPLPGLRHTFSHFHLDIQPVRMRLKKTPARVMEAGRQLWYKPHAPRRIGLPRPVTRLLSSLENRRQALTAEPDELP